MNTGLQVVMLVFFMASSTMRLKRRLQRVLALDRLTKDPLHGETQPFSLSLCNSDDPAIVGRNFFIWTHVRENVKVILRLCVSVCAYGCVRI